MQLEPALIEEIVRRVMAQLPAQGAAGHAGGTTPVGAATSAVSHRVMLTEPVITHDLLSERVNGSKQIVITQKALLTPSARDFVRTRGVQVIREQPAARSAEAQRWQVLAVSAATAAQVTDQFRASGAACEQKLCGSTVEAAAQAISAICRGEAEGVILLTTEPELAACLANRNDRVRAAAVTGSTAVERAKPSLKPNVWAIDVAQRTSFEMQNVVKSIVRQ